MSAVRHVCTEHGEVMNEDDGRPTTKDGVYLSVLRLSSSVRLMGE